MLIKHLRNYIVRNKLEKGLEVKSMSNEEIEAIDDKLCKDMEKIAFGQSYEIIKDTAKPKLGKSKFNPKYL